MQKFAWTLVLNGITKVSAYLWAVGTMSDDPKNVAFELRFRATVQDQYAREAISNALYQHATRKARRLRVQADLIDQGVPVERVRGAESDKI